MRLEEREITVAGPLLETLVGLQLRSADSNICYWDASPSARAGMPTYLAGCAARVQCGAARRSDHFLD